MQASRRDHLIESQDYRRRMTENLQQHIENVKILDPFALHPNSVTYNDEQAEQTFIGNTRRAAEVDVLIAYLPVASLGTAMEMWQAYEAGATIITVSELTHNWAIKFTSHEIYPSLEALFEAVENGRWRTWLTDKGEKRAQRRRIGLKSEK